MPRPSPSPLLTPPHLDLRILSQVEANARRGRGVINKDGGGSPETNTSCIIDEDYGRAGGDPQEEGAPHVTASRGSHGAAVAFEGSGQFNFLLLPP